MIQSVKITSKRQATFPDRVCKELGVKPGDEILLERREIDGHTAWLLNTKAPAPSQWFGALRGYAAGLPHDMVSIRSSIGMNVGRVVK